MMKSLTILTVFALCCGLLSTAEAQDSSADRPLIRVQQQDKRQDSTPIVRAADFKTVPKSNPEIRIQAVQRAETNGQGLLPSPIRPAIANQVPGKLPEVSLATKQDVPKVAPVAEANLNSPLDALQIESSLRPVKLPTKAKTMGNPFPHVARLPKHDLPPIVNSSAKPGSSSQGSSVEAKSKEIIRTNRGVRPRLRNARNQVQPNSNFGYQPNAQLGMQTRPWAGNRPATIHRELAGNEMLQGGGPMNRVGMRGNIQPLPQQPKIEFPINRTDEQPLQDFNGPAIVQPENFRRDRITNRSTTGMPGDSRSKPGSLRSTFEKAMTVGEVNEDFEKSQVVRADRPAVGSMPDSDRRWLNRFSKRRKDQNKTKLASFFENEMESIGENPSRYSGVSEVTQQGQIVEPTQTLDMPNYQYDVQSVTEAFGHSGYIARARQIYVAKAMYAFLDQNTVAGSNFFGTPGYDGTFGGQVGYIEKSGVWGREFFYTGFESWTTGRTVSSGGLAGMTALFQPGLGLGASFPFTNAFVQRQSAKARLHSIELNRSYWFWDVAKIQAGIRYTYFQDKYLLQSSNVVAGTYSMDAKNHLLGPQIGIEFFYDVGRRFAFTFRGKFGGGLNSYPTKINGVSNGAVFFNAEREEADWMWHAEMGLHAHWKISPCSRMVCGYDLLHLSQINNTTNMLISGTLPVQALNYRNDNELWVNALSFGIEFFR